MASEKINIWDLGNKINIKVKKEFIGFVNGKIKERFKNKERAYRELIKHYDVQFSTFKSRMKRGYKYFVDLDILLNLCKILDISLDELQDNILAYKIRRSHNYVCAPRLPIEISPIFDMLIAHHMSDGCLTKPKGKEPYFGYKQTNKEIRLLYIKKLESIFGKIYYNKDSHSTARQVYCPAMFTNLFLDRYSLDPEDYLEENNHVPQVVFNKNWKHKLAFLLGVILDEGHVDSNLIVIGLKNRRLLDDLRRICDDLQYTTTLSNDKKGRFYLYLLSKDMKKFYDDYQELLKEYPEVNLGYKGQKIKEFINRINKPKRYIKGNKEKLLLELLEGDLTVNELALKLNMTRQGARYLIKELAKEDKVKVKSIVKYAAYKYGLR